MGNYCSKSLQSEERYIDDDIEVLLETFSVPLPFPKFITKFSRCDSSGI